MGGLLLASLKIQNAERSDGRSGNSKFHTCKVTRTEAVPSSPATVTVPWYSPDLAVRGTKTSTQNGWFFPSATLYGVCDCAPLSLSDGLSEESVPKLLSGIKASAYQPAPSGRYADALIPLSNLGTDSSE